MTNQEISTLATIVSRFTELNAAAKQAKNGIQDVRFKTFEGVLSQDDLNTLERAQRILEELASDTNVRDAIKYHSKVTGQ